MKLTSSTSTLRLEKLEEMSFLVRTQASPLWTVNLSLVLKNVIFVKVLVIIYLDLGSRVFMEDSSLFM